MFDSNIYYSPEDYGLELIRDVELTDEPYRFNIIAVWKDKETGDLYMGEDAGCSCPTPFERVHSLGDLQEYDEKYFENVLMLNRKSAFRIEKPKSCPKCDERPVASGDYLCEVCRYG